MVVPFPKITTTEVMPCKLGVARIQLGYSELP